MNTTTTLGLLFERSYVGGEWIGADSGASYPVSNPSTGKVICNVPDMSVSETKRAIDAAGRALSQWRGFSAAKRSKILRRWYDLQIENVDELATILTMEQGKPLVEATGEIRYGASFVEWFAEEAKRVYGDVIPGQTADSRIVVLKQPIGVVAAITPWNFPNAMITRKIAPALAAGCTVVVKPAADTPLSALALAALGEEAGIPAGVLNVITTQSSAEVGAELTSNPLVRKVSFTGSTKVGKLLMKQSAETVKKVSLELGGNAPFIVFDDADVDAAVAGVIAAKFRNAGQTCICANRIYVQQSIYEAFSNRFAEAVGRLVVGDGMEEGTNIGPLISQDAVDKVDRLVADALTKGAKTVLGGASLQDKGRDRAGYFYEPTVLADVDDSMEMFDEEIFGPVAPLYSFSTETEVIEKANNTRYGLAAYFYGRDVNRVWRVAEALEYGMVGINTGSISTAQAPFGGVKESGLGREGSRYGIEEYLEIKYLCYGDIDSE